jgi:hypothetical protein
MKDCSESSPLINIRIAACRRELSTTFQFCFHPQTSLATWERKREIFLGLLRSSSDHSKVLSAVVEVEKRAEEEDIIQ